MQHKADTMIIIIILMLKLYVKTVIWKNAMFKFHVSWLFFKFNLKMFFSFFKIFNYVYRSLKSFCIATSSGSSCGASLSKVSLGLLRSWLFTTWVDLTGSYNVPGKTWWTINSMFLSCPFSLILKSATFNYNQYHQRAQYFTALDH